MSPFAMSIGTPDTPSRAICSFPLSRQENYGLAH
jgi:hypothetical protein